MLRKRLRDQHSNRTFVIGVVVVMMLFLGWIMEYGDRQVDMMDSLGLAEFRGKSVFEIFLSISVQQSLGALLGMFTLIVRLLPAALLSSFPVFVALAAIPWLASHFIHTLYNTKDLKEAYGFLERNVFGMQGMRPIIIVKEGHIAVGAGDLHDRVGGRALVIVYNDSAVVVEKGGRLVHVTGPVFGFLKPFERFWEVIDLRHQRWPFTVSAMTREGIPISCDADIVFKIDDRFIDEKGYVRVKSPVKATASATMDEEIDAELKKAGIGKPRPYTKDAVFRAATSIWVRIRDPEHSEQLRKWTGRVLMSEVEGTLRSILYDYWLDGIIRPPGPGYKYPREEIQEKLEQKLRAALAVDSEIGASKIGARVLSVALGEIDVDQDDKEKDEEEKEKRISTHWLEAWQAGSERRAVESQAEGEVELARLQATQVQARAEMVLALAEAIRPVDAMTEDLSSYNLATRFVETLWWMSYSPGVKAFMPPDAIRTLDELQKMLGKEKEKSSRETKS